MKRGKPRRKRGNSKPARKGKSITYSIELSQSLRRRESEVIARRNPIGELTGYPLFQKEVKP
jgi:hypothetical protein